VHVDIIDDGEHLYTIPDVSQNFIVANHMLEHCKNPIQTLETFLSKIKPGGFIYIGIPDKRFSFDRERELTTFEHLKGDYYNKNDHFPHYMEWTRFVNEIKDENEVVRQAHHLYQMQYSIHFHVWDYNSFVNFLFSTNEFLNFKYDILNLSFNDHREEVITILRKK
jgi:predicted SAM-dependent methyltransferase